VVGVIRPEREPEAAGLPLRGNVPEKFFARKIVEGRAPEICALLKLRTRFLSAVAFGGQPIHTLHLILS
jgi:hypothetical protein